MPPIPVTVSGLPGKMAAIIVRHLLADTRFALLPLSLTGPEITATECAVEGLGIRLVPPAGQALALAQLKAAHGEIIAVDYTHPSAVNANARLYCQQGVPFVMGTTGGNRLELVEMVNRSAIAAVIAPNMAKQIVGLQAMMEYAAKRFPGLFAGYRLTLRESHQQGKADTSGTARALVGCFNALGVPFDEEQIEMVRDPAAQRRLGVPEEHLAGHGWHTYTLISPDESVRFQWVHNVSGREIYAGGTLEAVAFLRQKLSAGAAGIVFNMIDVLEAGRELTAS